MAKKGQKWKECPIWISVVTFLIATCFIIGDTLVILRLRRYKRSVEREKELDAVTGIGNKEYFIRRYEQKIPDRCRASYCVVCFGFEIERVNQYYGEQEAEEQLRYAARILMEHTEKRDITARVSGGGFAVAHLCRGEKEAERWTGELLDCLNRYTEKFGRNYRPDFRGGIYMLQRPDKDAKTALSNARQGYLYAVGQNMPYAFSHSVFLETENEKMQLKKHCREAVRKREFRTYLQPVVSALDGRIVSAESLSRWAHPEKGLLDPGTYIELMEAERTIEELDFYIFEEVCRRLEKWAREGIQMSLSCNFTRITIDREDFIPQLKSIAEKYLFDYSSLILEITEDAMENNKKIAFENISRCKAMGFRIALDDTGSGYTSFSDLKDYPIDIVKIDRTILHSAVNERGIMLLRGMIALAHSLNMEILCEGVETERQLELCRQLGCDYMQGYYFYRPMPADEVERVLRGA